MKNILNIVIALIIASLPMLTKAEVFLSPNEIQQNTQRAANGNIKNLLKEIKKLKSEKVVLTQLNQFSLTTNLPIYDCKPGPTVCALNCTNRYSNGTCGSYGKDFCGPDAACAENCTNRYSNGTCGSYGPDICGPRISCAKNCTNRYSNGTCGSYGKDFCGPDASCVENCTNRYSNGTCGSYGPDICY